MRKQNILTILIVLLIVLGGAWYIKSQPNSSEQKVSSISISNKDTFVTKSGNLEDDLLVKKNNSPVKKITDLEIKGYIKENLVDLSPVDGVLGGTMRILGINLLDKNKFEVYQEDGHFVNFFSGEYMAEDGSIKFSNIKNLGSDYYHEFISNSNSRVCCKTHIPERDSIYKFSLNTECSIQSNDYTQSIVPDSYCSG